MCPTVVERSRGPIAAIGWGFTASLACMAVFVGAVMVSPITAPALWLGVPASLVLGMVIIHRRVPRDSYIIGLVFVPIVGALLTLAALQVYWTVLGDSI